MGRPTSQAALRRRDHAAAEPRRDEASQAEHLQRLEASVSWLQRESMIAALDAEVVATKRAARLPRARQLPSIPGLPPVGTEHNSSERVVLDFEPAPPIASDRFLMPPPGRERSFELRAALFILLGSIVAGSIAYHLSTGGSILAAAQAQVAAFDAR
jgi:hypothetical protein